MGKVNEPLIRSCAARKKQTISLCILNRVAVRADLERSLKTILLMQSESLAEESRAEDEEQEDKMVLP